MVEVLVLLLGIVLSLRLSEFLSSSLIKTTNEVSDASNRVNGVLLLIAGIGLLIFFFGSEQNGWIKLYN